MIRVATPGDCEALAAVHVKSWQQAYVGLVPQWYLDGLSVRDRAENWRQALQEGSTTVLLDFENDELAGFAGIGPSSDTDALPTCGEVGALYYLQEYWGQGYSAQLLAAAVDELRNMGFSLATLWVLHDNDRAISFYRKCGFEIDGVEKTDTSEGFSLHEVRMRA